MDTGTRTGISYLANDGSDPVTAYRTSIRSIVAALEAAGALYSQGLLSARPAAGTVGRFYRATDDVSGVIYYDDGSTWQSVGTSAAVDAAAGVGSLRTLGAGALQAAAGNHAHAIGAITGTGDSVTKNVGTATGTVAAGNHTHSAATLTGVVGVTYVTKASDTTRSVTVVQADDPDLQLALGTGTHHLTALLAVTASNATPDVSVTTAFTGTATTPIIGMVGPATSNTAMTTGGSAITSANSSPLAFGADGATPTLIQVQVILVVTASGTFKIQWAQATSSAATTTMKAGSTIVAYKIA